MLDGLLELALETLLDIEELELLRLELLEELLMLDGLLDD